ncbi:MAG: hypothetical protein R6U13_11355 [Desulfatiglandaceae bacterium]
MTGKQGRERTLIQHWWRRYAAVLVAPLCGGVSVGVGVGGAAARRCWCW